MENQLEQTLIQLNSEGNLFPGFQFVAEDGQLVKLGQGGASSIYLMANEQQNYALKVISQDMAPNQYFQSEIYLQNQVGTVCENVVRIIDATECNVGLMRLQLILMEQLEPIMTINKFHKAVLLREELATEEGVLHLARDIAKALMVAHHNGILHRDVKLENIFWDDKLGCYKLGDFGVATAQITNRTMTRLGSEGYVAPEVLNMQERAHYNESADIYSFGMCLYVLLNQLRFPGSNSYRPVGMQYESDFVFPAPVNASEKMARIIRTMCSYNVENRYDSMQEILAELNMDNALYEDQVAEETLDDAATVHADETTAHFDGTVNEAWVENKLASNNEESEYARHFRLVEEKNRNKQAYRKIERRYMVALVPLFIIVMAGVMDLTQDIYAGYDFYGIKVALGLVALTLTPALFLAAIPGALFSSVFMYWIPEWLLPLALLVLNILVQELLNIRIRYKQGNKAMLFYYRLGRYLLPCAIVGCGIYASVTDAIAYPTLSGGYTLMSTLIIVEAPALLLCIIKDFIVWRIHLRRKR